LSSDDQKKNEKGRGFTGLSSMVSDVDSEVSSASNEDPHQPEGLTEEVPQGRPPGKDEGGTGLYQQHSQHSSGEPSGKKWWIGIVIVIGFIWLMSSSGSKNSSTPTSYSNPPYITPSASAPAPPTSSAPSQPGQFDPNATSRPTEVMPDVGTNNILDVEQIRYCVAEKIRLDASENAVDRYNRDEIDRFNAMAADFNSRCGQYRYRQGTLELAISDMEPYRAQLEAEGANRFAHRSKTSKPKPEASRSRQAPENFASADDEEPSNASIRLTGPERESIEAACSTDKYVNGPAAYRACLNMQIAALQKSVRRPDLSGLSTAERDSIEAACSTDKYVKGPAAYNRCLSKQLAVLKSQSRRPSLSGLTSSERESIEAACSTDKYVNGPAAYNSCLYKHLQSLKQQGGRPDLSGLSPAERQSIESTCFTDKYMNGPAAYNECLSQQMSRLRN
jgi:hypothetical protein